MAIALKHIFSGGPFSAVKPHYERPKESVPVTEEELSEPSDSFDSSRPPSDSATPPADDLRKEAGRSGARAALGAFPQVVHLLVEPNLQWGESLSQEVGLPVVSLAEVPLEGLQEKLHSPEYSRGFILEGIPQNAGQAEALDGLLENVPEDGRRVLSWELTSDTHQEVLDHYMDRDLLWMVPESTDPSNTDEARSNVLSCLHGLPALQ